LNIQFKPCIQIDSLRRSDMFIAKTIIRSHQVPAGRPSGPTPLSLGVVLWGAGGGLHLPGFHRAPSFGTASIR
jgi:hypothetical protein